ncbi:MAG TPA: hypothetical protein VNJ03_06385 [Vicinamibacterales bacterium]|nr:hypothetical protein [Vicinamibacterales bacterium]
MTGASGSPVRMLATAAALVMGFAVAASAQAPAEEAPKMKFGPVELRPRLLFHNIGVDNNVYNVAENPTSDYTFGAQPDMQISMRPGRLRFIWLTGTEFVYYHREKTERSANQSQNLTADVDLNFMRPFISYSSANTSARANAEVDLRAKHQPRALSAGSSFRMGTRSTASVSWKRAREKYDDDGSTFRGQKLSETLNSQIRTLEGSVGLVLTPVTTVSLVLGRDDLTFDLAPIRNSKSLRIAPTVNFTPGGPISGSASIGYRKLDGEDATLPDYSGLAMNGGIVMLLGGRFRFETRFARDVQYSYESSLPYFVLTGGRATLATQLSDLIDVRLTGGRDLMAYRAYGGQPSPGSDNLDIYGGGVGFLIGDRKRFVITAEFVRRQSARDRSREFRNNRIFGALTFGA